MFHLLILRIQKSNNSDYDLLLSKAVNMHNAVILI